MLQPFWQDHQWLMDVIIVAAVGFYLVLSGCAYRDYGNGDAGWVNIAHDPQNDPYYWAHISHAVRKDLPERSAQ